MAHQQQQQQVQQQQQNSSSSSPVKKRGMGMHAQPAGPHQVVNQNQPRVLGSHMSASDLNYTATKNLCDL